MNWIALCCLLLGTASILQAVPSSQHTSGDTKAEYDMLRNIKRLLREELKAIQVDEKQQKRSSGTPSDKWEDGQSAARTMRAFSKTSKRTRQDMLARSESQEKLIRHMKSLDVGDDLMKRVLELDLQTRADVHPTCDTSTSCEDRIYIADATGTDKEYRKANGTCNNVANPDWGSQSVQHVRWEEPVYPNAIFNIPIDVWAQVTKGEGRVDLPHPRAVSNAVHSAGTSTDNEAGISMALLQFLQFVSHDLISTPEGDVPTSRDCCTDDKGFCMPIIMEEDDDTFAEGYCMDARRSATYLRDCDGSEQQNQFNEITAYIDANNVYGSSQEEQDSLRSFVAGQLKVSNMDFPPEYTGDDDLPCSEDGTDGGFCFATGDHRANVIPTLTAAHVLFLREHNRIAKFFADSSDWEDEKIFQVTRKIVAAQMQHIVYEEVLPVIMDDALLTTWGVSRDYVYDESVDASISSSFSIAFRFGHTLIPDVLNVDGETQNVTFLYETPSFLFEHNYGRMDELQDYVDTTLVKKPDESMSDSARNTLFFDGTDSFDLASLNIARSREWGTPSYSVYKAFCGHGDTDDWDALLDTHSQDSIDALASVYNDPADVDLFTGVVTEIKIGSSFLGSVGSCLIGKQFHNLKHGDRFWYQTTDTSVGFTDDQLTELEKSTYAAIICLNSGVASVSEEAFKLNSETVDCSIFDEDDYKIDLAQWSDE